MSSVRDGYRKHGVIILDGFTLSIIFQDDIKCNFFSWKKKTFCFASGGKPLVKMNCLQSTTMGNKNGIQIRRFVIL